MIACCLMSVFTSVYSSDKSSRESKKNTKVITIEKATIIGNQELPTVLYLVPWQPPQINALEATQTTDLTAQSIELIDRRSFQRRLNYYEDKKN